ncbi:MAG: N-acetylmuramoyl-L-alanine amidase [Firmicutes bacterium]|nr:N-acetylmuramoyl-L-alanine amidase [Bacillota bacterium]
MNTDIKTRFTALLYMLLIFVGAARVYHVKTQQTAAMPVQKKHIVIDAGHGGFDPGKVAADGTEEKNINLEIAKYLQAYLEQGGADVTVTRLSDEALSSGKSGDLKNRISLQKGCDIFVSIHQNSYPSAKVHGAQVFYLKNSENGKRLAHAVQARIKQTADVDNSRSPKENSSYYILKNSAVPSIIVECGFLSNPNENAKLTDKNYQKKMAWAIYMGITDYFARPNA